MELQQVKQPNGWKVELLSEGRSISRLWIVDRHMRLGAGRVYVGGIAGVGTEPEYRYQGLSRRVLEAALDLMGREGYDASFLFGIQDFYHRFGFTTVMAEHGVRLTTLAAEKAKRKLQIRSVRQGDFSAIARLYNRDNQYRTGSTVRQPRCFTAFSMGSDFGVPVAVKVLVTAANKLVGYVAYDDVKERCRAVEVGGQGEAVFSTALNFLARRAVALRREHISLSMPADYPFALYCTEYGLHLETHYKRQAGPMGRVINLRSFLSGLQPALALRWDYGKSNTMELCTDIGSCNLQRVKGELKIGTAGGGPTDKVRLKQTAFMQLAMGYRTAASLVVTGELRAKRQVIERLDRLFPLQQAHMWWPDRF